MASSTDVRKWLQEQGRGEEAGTRGAVKQDLVAEYEAAMRVKAGPVVAGEVLSSGPDVTEADFPPAPEPDFVDSAGETPPAGRERRPRKVSGPSTAQKVKQKVFGGRGKGKRRTSSPRNRASLGDFAEDTWTDLAWLSEPIPPLSKILTVQAPFAGTVVDDAVKGTFVDDMLQPLARHAGVFRILNGLAGPPVYVSLICLLGGREQITNPQTGQPATLPDGTPMMDYDARTKMMFAGLRYSLLQMTKISDVRADEIRERTESMASRMAVVDAIIADLFALPAAPGVVPAQAQQPEAPEAPGSGGGRTFTYPEPPVMDWTGADPNRMQLSGDYARIARMASH